MLALYVQLQELALRFRRDRRGVTAMEYGLIAAIISVVVIAVFTQLSAGLTTTFTRIAAALN